MYKTHERLVNYNIRGDIMPSFLFLNDKCYLCDDKPEIIVLVGCIQFHLCIRCGNSHKLGWRLADGYNNKKK